MGVGRGGLDEFQRHWRKHALPEVSAAKQKGAQSFLAGVVAEIRLEDIETRILDVGCGDGVHAEALAGIGIGARLRYCGIDFSTRALDLAQRRVADKRNFSFVAGDAVSLPVASHSMEVVFAYGVLAYTTSPEEAFAEMVRVCRPGGLVGLWMFPRISGLSGRLFKLTRLACRLGGPLGAWLIIRAIVLCLPVLPLNSGINLNNASWRQCVEVLEASLLPRTLYFFLEDEVRQWFQRHGVDIVKMDEEQPVTFWGRVR